MPDMAKSFSFLQDNIPQWLDTIATAERKMIAMQDQVVRIVASQTPFVHKKRSNSIESIRPGTLDGIPEDIVSNGAQTDPAGKRKRKTTSIHSGRASGPSRYRSRTMVIVNYDGDMQKSFEDLVRAIGTGRNMLRKAKMEAKMHELEALHESSDDDGEHDTETDQDLTTSRPSVRPRMSSMRAMAAMRRGAPITLRTTSNTTIDVLDCTDKMLERAQELCEKAAHLTLRDGDCRKELVEARKNFETVLETARNEVVKSTARKSQDPPELISHDTSDTSVSSIDTPYKDHFSPVTPLPVSDPVAKPTFSIAPGKPATTEPKIVDMEVDDDEEDDNAEFVMPPIRLTSRLAARG
ncbi:hypothetical protein ACN47E_009232 [Coniothyrium glycines]